MPLLVHLAAEKDVQRIRRGGIRCRSKGWNRLWGVFSMPVVPNFYVSHQWLRELKRRGQRRICGVYFRIPDDEEVWVGHYIENQSAHGLQLPCAEAVKLIERAESQLGYEIIVTRAIKAKEIKKVRHLPQVVGWRYAPDARSRPICTCPICLPRGQIKSRRLRARFGDASAEAFKNSSAQTQGAPP